MMNVGGFGWNLQSDAPMTAPGTIGANPNILMIMVDQLRLPQFWLSGAQQTQVDQMCPNIAWLRNNSYRFWNFYVCAQACTPSRATLLTGLYAPQTGVFATQVDITEPDLNPAYNTGAANPAGFPTFGNALQDIVGYEAGNVMWFGKWHVSNRQGLYNYSTGLPNGKDTMPLYGFNAGRSSQIMRPSYYGSPNGSPNQGPNGYFYDPPNSPIRSRQHAVRQRLSACPE